MNKSGVRQRLQLIHNKMKKTTALPKYKETKIMHNNNNQKSCCHSPKVTTDKLRQEFV